MTSRVGEDRLLSIGAAAARTGVTERALRYYQELGLLTPCASTPGGMRRYSGQDLARVARIRQLQTLLGLNLDEIAVVLRNEDRMAQIKDAYHREQTSEDERRELTVECLRLQQELRGTVLAKRQGIENFLADLDARISRTADLLSAQAICGPADGPLAGGGPAGSGPAGGALAGGGPAGSGPGGEEGRARAGRPRDPLLESRVLAAALGVYAEAGWSGFSFDAVARRAGVGRAPLYLRWQSKEDLLLAALSAHSSPVPPRSRGSLRDDLAEYATRLLESSSRPQSWAFVRMQLEATINPTLHARFSSEIAVPHLEAARAVLRDAVERGDLPGETPVDLVLASLYGAIFNRMTLSPDWTGDPRRYAEYLVDFVLGRLPKALRSHRRF